ncbi:hypothetical protein LCGC14_0484970 [marine sediment metagenome]|uniref:Uncharacterized protein n=1 Tax=marine sediment metagenome TaxID=412755 RepID=A0A0F9SDK7_9ZZZZ
MTRFRRKGRTRGPVPKEKVMPEPLRFVLQLPGIDDNVEKFKRRKFKDNL